MNTLQEFSDWFDSALVDAAWDNPDFEVPKITYTHNNKEELELIALTFKSGKMFTIGKVNI